MQHYTAIIVDIVASKRYKSIDRSRLQDHLVRCIQILNEAFASSLAKEVDFSGGDEVQGLFLDGWSAFLYCRLLGIFMLPHHLRGGIGMGEWETRVPDKGTAAQDGSVYHMAREAITRAHRLKTQSISVETRVDSSIELNLLINASVLLQRSLSSAQLDMLHIMEIMYPLNHSRIIDTKKLRPLLAQEFGSNTVEPKDVQDIELLLSIDTSPEEKVSPRNMVSILSNFNRTTLQNVSNLIQRGNLLYIRSIDYFVACKLLNEEGEQTS